MKSAIKWFAIALGGLIGAAIPLSIFYFAWSWVIDQVPKSSEWAGLIKIGISFVMVATGGTLTVICAALLGSLFAAMAIAALEP